MQILTSCTHCMKQTFYLNISKTFSKITLLNNHQQNLHNSTQEQIRQMLTQNHSNGP